MVVIRLARAGRSKYPTYRIVAADSKRAATGKVVEVLGHYNPHTKELVIKKEETLKRIGNGAQPSNTIVKLMLREKMELPGWVKLKTKQAKVVETEKVEVDEAPVEEAASPKAKTEDVSAESAEVLSPEKNEESPAKGADADTAKA